MIGSVPCPRCGTSLTPSAFLLTLKPEEAAGKLLAECEEALRVETERANETEVQLLKVKAALRRINKIETPECDFCHGKSVTNAAEWIDGKKREPAPCPRCGKVALTEERGEGPIADSKGNLFLLVTQSGGNDPDGQGGFVHMELGGSGCRWVRFDPEDPEQSKAELERARAWHWGETSLFGDAA